MEIKKLVSPSSEDQIKKHWKHKDKVYISCVCITYNQSKYIRDTIDGFLAQITQYRFEIIIHDDASIDDTHKILIEYKEKFPSIIKLILQKENQYKLGKKITPLAVNYSCGKYVAICEGDDYWIDKFKLEKQASILELHEDCNIVISRAISLYHDNTTSLFCDLGGQQKNIDFDNCIIGPKKDFFSPATFFIRRCVFQKLPAWYYDFAPVGDYYLFLYASHKSGAIYIPDTTSVYRRESTGSWSETNKSDGFTQIYKRLECSILLKKTLCKVNSKALITRALNHYLGYFMRNIFNKGSLSKNIKLIMHIFFTYPSLLYRLPLHYIKKIYAKE